MISARIRDLRNNLRQYLRPVSAGESIAVTIRGRVVAELHPPQAAKPASPDRCVELVASGALRPRTEDGAPLADWPPEALRLPPGTAAALIDADRGS